MRSGVDQHRQRAADERIESAMLVDRFGDQLRPTLGNMTELCLPLLHRLLEEADHLRPQRGGGRMRGVLDPRQPLELRRLVFLGLLHAGSRNRPILTSLYDAAATPATEAKNSGT